MGQWFPTVDDALGGAADTVDSGSDFILGEAGDALSGPFQAITGFWLKMAALILGAVVVVKVI